MAITYTGTNGFFTRIGKLFKIVDVADTFKTTLKEEIEDLYGEYVATTGGDAHAHPSGPVDSWQISSIAGAKDQIGSSMFSGLDALDQEAANNILIGTIRDGLGRTVSNTQDAFLLLRDDMVKHGSAYYVASSDVSAGSLATDSDNVGDGTVLWSTNRPVVEAGGASQEYQTIRAESLRFNCTADFTTGGTPGLESFNVIGEESFPRTNKKWPAGSGTKTVIGCTSAGPGKTKQANHSRNLLANSNFDTWSSSSALHLWTISSGGGNNLAHTAGGEGGALAVDVTRSTTTFGSRGSYTLQFNGNNSHKHVVTQKINNAEGTYQKLHANCSYIWACRIKAHTTTITSGVFKIGLHNAASSALSGTSITKDFSSSNQNSSWTLLTGVIDIGESLLVSDTRARIEFTTALQAGRSLLIDELVLFKPTELYSGGPQVGIVRGATDFRNNDRFDLTFTNDYAGKINKFFDKFYGTNNFPASLPTAGSTSLTDGTYIT